MKVRIVRKSRLREKNNKDDRSVDDDVYGYDEIRRLGRGIVEVLEDEGVIQKGLFEGDDFEWLLHNDLGEGVVGDEVIYKKAKQIQGLDKHIKNRIQRIKWLDTQLNGHKCKPPTTDQLFAYCDRIIRISKGKLNDK